MAAAVVGLSAALLLPASAAAGIIMVGSPLQGEFASHIQIAPERTATVLNTSLADPLATVVSPVNGLVVRWHVLPMPTAEEEPFALRVLHPIGAGEYIGTATSVAGVTHGTAPQTFATALPIKAGDAIGLDLLNGQKGIPTRSTEGLLQDLWVPRFLDGAPSGLPGQPVGIEFAYDAEVQPAPKVSVISPGSGASGGGTIVTIAGSDFSGVTEVRFGAAPAVAFHVVSESEITATAPPGAAGPADVTVTTIAGTSPSVPGDLFTYSAPPAATPSSVTPPAPPPNSGPACVVPKVIGKKPAAAKSALRTAHCKLGTVRGRKDPKVKVVAQSPKAGTSRPDGATVSIKLG